MNLAFPTAALHGGLLSLLCLLGTARALAADDVAIVTQLDRVYQTAVARHDAAVMDLILADDFVLVTGNGKTFSRQDLLDEARSGRITYDRQEASARTVRVWGDTAVVTALLWARGRDGDKAFDHRLWFSDTYVRTPQGWRYVLGQASLPLPPSPA